MVIKVWNNWDGGVLKVNLDPDKSRSIIGEQFTPAEQKKIKKIAKEFAEQLGLEFVHNLKEGWEEELLRNGRVLSRDGTKKLTTKAEIEKELSAAREINFFAEKKFGSWAIIKELLKPKRLCWD